MYLDFNKIPSVSFCFLTGEFHLFIILGSASAVLIYSFYLLYFLKFESVFIKAGESETRKA